MPNDTQRLDDGIYVLDQRRMKRIGCFKLFVICGAVIHGPIMPYRKVQMQTPPRQSMPG